MAAASGFLRFDAGARLGHAGDGGLAVRAEDAGVSAPGWSAWTAVRSSRTYYPVSPSTDTTSADGCNTNANPPSGTASPPSSTNTSPGSAWSPPQPPRTARRRRRRRRKPLEEPPGPSNEALHPRASTRSGKATWSPRARRGVGGRRGQGEAGHLAHQHQEPAGQAHRRQTHPTRRTRTPLGVTPATGRGAPAGDGRCMVVRGRPRDLGSQKRLSCGRDAAACGYRCPLRGPRPADACRSRRSFPAPARLHAGFDRPPDAVRVRLRVFLDHGQARNDARERPYEAAKRGRHHGSVRDKVVVDQGVAPVRSLGQRADGQQRSCHTPIAVATGGVQVPAAGQRGVAALAPYRAERHPPRTQRSHRTDHPRRSGRDGDRTAGCMGLEHQEPPRHADLR